MVATVLLVCGVRALVRTGGFTASSFHNDLHWRWTKTPEERLMAKSGNEPGALLPGRAAGATPQKPLVGKSGNEPDKLPPVRMDGRRALDLERAEALLQRLRRTQWPCLRLRRQHPRVHRPQGRQAHLEGRTVRQRPARPAARLGRAAGAVGRGVNWRWSRQPPINSPSSRGSRRSRARPGTTWCWPATSCW